MRLVGVIGGTITGQDRPFFFGEVFTTTFGGVGEEVTGPPGDSPWLNVMPSVPDVWANVPEPVAAVPLNVAEPVGAAWLNV
jgi:hypothetical protein